jgi:hypothetical protein
MIEVKGRREKGRRQLLNYLKETTGYWKPKVEALHRTLCKTRFGSGYVRTCPKTGYGANDIRIPVFRGLSKFHDANYMVVPPVIQIAPTSPFSI